MTTLPQLAEPAVQQPKLSLEPDIYMMLGQPLYRGEPAGPWTLAIQFGYETTPEGRAFLTQCAEAHNAGGHKSRYAVLTAAITAKEITNP